MIVGLIVFVAAMVQGLLGFGGALIAMPLLVMIIGIQTATPAYALLGALSTLLNTIRLRHHTTPGDLARLVLPALVGIPLGILLLTRVDSTYVTATLGIILIVYALYNLLGWTVPPLAHPAWAFLAGFSSGILSGAFNAGGPPVIVYASTRSWSADRFRGNLQTYFLIVSIFLLIGHAMSGHFTADIGRMVLLAAPALVVGQMVGARLCRYVEGERFRKLVLWVLLLLGLQLLFG